MFWSWVLLAAVLAGVVAIIFWQKEEPKRFKKYIEKERKFIKKMIDFDKK